MSSSFMRIQAPIDTGRRTVRVQAVGNAGSAAPAILGAALTIAAILASMLVFAAL